MPFKLLSLSLRLPLDDESERKSGAVRGIIQVVARMRSFPNVWRDCADCVESKPFGITI